MDTKEPPSTQSAEIRALLADGAALRRAASDSLRAQMPAVQALFLDELQRRGILPSYVSPIAPLVYLTATKRVIVELARHAAVETIYGPNKNHDALDVAFVTQKANYVRQFGLVGEGISVAILEDSRVDFTNPYLTPGLTRVPGDPNIDDHATACAGIVASEHFEFAGFARSSSLLSANATTYEDADIAAALDWAAATQNVDVINNSWGDESSLGLNQHDRHCDYIVRNLWSTITVAAGNEGLGSGWVGSPGKAFNVITVGGFDDNDTITWSDDSMYAGSSYVDPASGCQKPEVVAPAVDISSTLYVTDLGLAGSGTSFAAPMVAGQAACVMGAIAISQFPETVKALTLAGALHNIEGASLLSQLDGAGACDARATADYESTAWSWLALEEAEFPDDVFVACEAGERVRGVICWNSNPNATYTTDPLQGDLILRAFAPSGALIMISDSFDNSYEIVEFIAPATGAYRFEIDYFAFGGITEFVGFGAFKGSKVLTPNVVESYTPVPPVMDNFRTGPSAFWNVAATSGAENDGRYLYNESPWGDPAEHGYLDYLAVASPTVGATDLAYLVIDGNHAPSDPHHIEVQASIFSGSAPYSIEHTTRVQDISIGSSSAVTMTANELVEVFDVNFAAGAAKWIAIQPISGNLDLGIFLHDSNPASASTVYQSRLEAVAASLAAPADEYEWVTHTSTAADWLGLIVANLGGTDDTQFIVHADTSAPAATVTINSAASQTGASRVQLEVTASDVQTEVRRLRIRNVPGTFGPWQPFASSILWELAPGAGTRTVEVEVQNHACMSAIATDSITVYACPVAPGPLSNGNFSMSTGYPWCFSDESESGFVSYATSQAVVTGGSDGDGDYTVTYISQQVVTPAGVHELTFDWSFTTGNSPGYDGAYYDLINATTGSSLVGGPQTLADASGSSGTESASFIGGSVVEIRLGTFSDDNLFAPGVSAFDNVALALIACGGVTSLTCIGATGSAVLSWTNGALYTEVRVARDGGLIATLAGSATTFTDTAAAPGAHTYTVTGVCAGGVPASTATCVVTVGAAGGGFVRTDCNTSGSINVADVVYLLNYLFVPGSPPSTCFDACDGNDDGGINIADAIYVLNYLFVPGSPLPPAPFAVCAADPTADSLGCAAYAVCMP